MSMLPSVKHASSGQTLLAESEVFPPVRQQIRSPLVLSSKRRSGIHGYIEMLFFARLATPSYDGELLRGCYNVK